MARKQIDIPANLSELVGATPMVRFGRLAAGLDAEVIGKLEAYNPAGSVKDRIGVAMIEAAERGRADRAGRHNGDRADLRQHRDRACLRVRGSVDTAAC